MQKSFFKTDPFNFVPFAKTPWAGTRISELKKKYFPELKEQIPEFIGESIEFSSNTYSLLLKWLEAQDFLSVQVHPQNDNLLLKSNECGKPESWLVLDVEYDGYVYLGFQEKFSKEQIISLILKGEVEKCLFRYFPEKMDYISIPTGCVHAVGKGVFVAEPQLVVPEKIGKTWRLYDWDRLYDEKGILSADGTPRELHIEEALSAIDWTLPRGLQIVNELVRPMRHTEAFAGDAKNPFALQVFSRSGTYPYVPLHKNSFSIITVVNGEVTLSSNADSVVLHGGETALISAEVESVSVSLTDKYGDTPYAAFFASGGPTRG